MQNNSLVPVSQPHGGVSRVPESAADKDNTPIQLALDIFSSLEPTEQGIAESPQEIGFRKNNLFLEITGLGLTARRAIDVAYFIVSQPKDDNDLYEESHAYRYVVDQKFFKWLMGTSSRNWNHLKSVLREAQGAAIEITSSASSGTQQENDKPTLPTPSGKDGAGTKWGAVPLLGAVAIQNGKVYFEVNPTLAKHIKNPQSYHFLSLRYVFKSLYAKILYELLLPYVSNEVTPWIGVEDFRKAMGSTPKSYNQYKFLRQHVVLPATNEINNLTDLQIEAETMNLPHTKKVGYIRFKIQVKEDAVLDPTKRLKELYLILRKEFGVNGKQIDEIISNGEKWDLEYIYDAIEYTRYMLRNNKIKLSVGGYLLKALREGYKLGTAQLELEGNKVKQAKKEQDRFQPPNPYAQEILPPKGLEDRAQHSKLGLDLYTKADENIRDVWRQAFLESPQARLAALRDKLPKDKWEASLERPCFLREEFGCFLYYREDRK